MLQAGSDADLALEALGAERCGELGAKHLEGDEAVVVQVPREVHRCHAALTELALDRVAAGQRRPELVGRACHRAPAISAIQRSLCWSPRLK